MGHPIYINEEIARRGQQIYESQIRQALEQADHGKYVVIDVETGDFEIDESDIAAIRRSMAKHSEPALFTLRVGFPVASRLGSFRRIGTP